MDSAEELGINIVGESISAEPDNLLDKIRAFALARRVKIVEKTPQDDDLENLITIIGGGDIDSQIRIFENQPQEELEICEESLIRFAVSVQENRKSAQVFVNSLRLETADLLGNSASLDDYTENQWYQFRDLRQLADRWLLPFATLERGRHFLLLLKPPEQRADGYSVLVYDPMIGGETYVDLPNWRGTMDVNHLAENNILVNDLALEQLTKGDYNLSLLGDSDFATNVDLYREKMDRVQFDGYNCGPACLFMAAVREGAVARKEWSGFKFSGRDQLKEDIFITILTREEILDTVSRQGAD